MKIEKILIIRFRRVGDALLSSSLCNSLKTNFPEAQVHYVLNDTISPLFFHHLNIDKIISFNSKERNNIFLYIWKVFSLMRKEKYDVIIDARSTINTLLFALFSPFSKFRIGIKKGYNKHIHNYRIETQKTIGDEIDKTLSLLQPLSAVKELTYVKDFSLFVTKEEKDTFKTYMQDKGISFSKKIILCVPITRLSTKQWDLLYFKEILKKIIDEYDAQIILNYSLEEKDLVEQFHRDMNENPNIFTNIEAKSLRDLLALTSLVDFFFGNEGGARHISQAFSIPSFALFSPDANKDKWMINKDEKYQAISSSDLVSTEVLKNMSTKEKYDLITVEIVWDLLHNMLNKYL